MELEIIVIPRANQIKEISYKCIFQKSIWIENERGVFIS